MEQGAWDNTDAENPCWHCLVDKLREVCFPNDVMEIIARDHHKNGDGSLDISYNFYYESRNLMNAKPWSITHTGYVRGVIKAEGKTFEETAKEFIAQMEAANEYLRRKNAEPLQPPATGSA